MSTGNVMPVPQQQFCDTNGKPYALGTLTFYAAGTTNPQDTYFNSDLAVGHKNANPLTLDGDGRALVYFSPLGYRVILKDANGVQVYDQDNVYGVALGSDVVTLQAEMTALLGASGGNNGICEGRLTLTSGVPVTTGEVTAATMIYFTPYKGSRIALYSGTAWALYNFSELSASISGFTASKPFDVFAYNNSGTVAIETLVWTNDTTRATALAVQDGVYVKTGATTRRYIGTFRTTSSTGQTEDSYANRLVWNYYNRVQRVLHRFETTDSWAYTTQTWRQANNSTANQVGVTVGVAEVGVDLWLVANAANTNAGVNIAVFVQKDAVTAPAAPWSQAFTPISTTGANYLVATTAHLYDLPAAGYHFYPWMEYSTATGTTTWYGDNGGAVIGPSSGLTGYVLG